MSINVTRGFRSRPAKDSAYSWTSSHFKQGEGGWVADALTAHELLGAVGKGSKLVDVGAHRDAIAAADTLRKVREDRCVLAAQDGVEAVVPRRRVMQDAGLNVVLSPDRRFLVHEPQHAACQLRDGRAETERLGEGAFGRADVLHGVDGAAPLINLLTGRRRR
ncbi:hypothetical protein [Cupriavidus necator]|uniref:hypothetical protein n=1 Tax=Cupriavidus necator TaxID=106590 RepID=UPI003F73B806